MSQKKLPFFSIIVPSYNSETTIKKCINSLLKINYPKERYEIIISDDGSKDNTLKLVSSYSNRIKVIRNKHKGPSHARNVGIKNINKNSRFVLFIDSDSKVHKDILLQHLAVYKKFPSCNAVSGKIHYYGKKNFFSKIIEKSDMFPMRSGDYGNLIWASSNNFSIKLKRKNIKFDEKFPHAAGEDIDFSWRLRRSRIIYNDKAIVYHKRHNSFLQSIKRAFRYGKGTSHLIKKYPQRSMFSINLFFRVILLSFFLLLPFIGVFDAKWLLFYPLFLLMGTYFILIGYAIRREISQEGIIFIITLSFIRFILLFVYHMGIFLENIKLKNNPFYDIKPQYMVYGAGNGLVYTGFLNDLISFIFSILIITYLGVKL